jgi:tellurite methyltransferase
MLQDRLKWNEKYQTQPYPRKPSRLVKQFFNLAKGNRALDIGAGNGRNALFLAKRGFRVDAVDISDVGLGLFAGKHAHINPICADLDVFKILANHYDLILNINFLNRRLFPYIQAGLARGGILIFETFLETSSKEMHHPSCRDYLLRANELLHAFLSLKILYYREGEDSTNGDSVHLASLVGMQTRQ